MNINKQTNANYQNKLAIEIFTNKSMLLFGHHLNQLTKLHHSFIKVFIVRSAVNKLYNALSLITIYNNAQYGLPSSLTFFFCSTSIASMIILIT